MNSVRGVDPNTVWVHVDPNSAIYGWKLMSQDVYDAWLKSIGERPQPQEVIETRPGNCECGASSIGASRHAPYCPAFEK